MPAGQSLKCPPQQAVFPRAALATVQDVARVLHPARGTSLSVKCSVSGCACLTAAPCPAAPSYDFRVQLHTLATKKGFDARPVSGITPDKCMPSPQIELNEPLLVQQDEAEHGHMHPSALLTAADVLRSLMQQGKEVSPEGLHCPAQLHQACCLSHNTQHGKGQRGSQAVVLLALSHLPQRPQSAGGG